MDRFDKIKSMVDISGRGLEIGASYNPVLRKSDGYDIRIVDYASASKLREIHAKEDIEEVDYVTDGASLLRAIPERAFFDYIIASHVIEHTPDMVRFLQDCGALLKPGGVLSLAVPDKRHCFDLYQSASSAGDVLQAYQEARTRHSLARVFDSKSSVISREGHIVWPMSYSGETSLIHDVWSAKALFDQAIETDQYIDAHAWYFLPSTFRLIIEDLYALDVIPLREFKFIDSEGPEFYVGLSREGAGTGLDRITLLRQGLAESQIVPCT